MAERRIGIIVNGATGRMGYRQHLVRSLLAIRAQGGVEIADGDRLVPDLLLVGRNEEKLRTIAERRSEERRVGKEGRGRGVRIGKRNEGVEDWTTREWGEGDKLGEAA